MIVGDDRAGTNRRGQMQPAPNATLRSPIRCARTSALLAIASARPVPTYRPYSLGSHIERDQRTRRRKLSARFLVMNASKPGIPMSGSSAGTGYWRKIAFKGT